MSSKIYPVEAIGAGSLSAMAKPEISEGLDAEIQRIANHGITKIVSLLAKAEAEELGLQTERQVAEKIGLQFDQYSIGDFGVPASLPEYSEFVRRQYEAIVAGQHIVVHCHAGIGRTGILSASILLLSGYDALDAFKLISKKRGVSVPDTQTQVDWVCDNQIVIRDGFHA